MQLNMVKPNKIKYYVLFNFSEPTLDLDRANIQLAFC